MENYSTTTTNATSITSRISDFSFWFFGILGTLLFLYMGHRYMYLVSGQEIPEFLLKIEGIVELLFLIEAFWLTAISLRVYSEAKKRNEPAPVGTCLSCLLFIICCGAFALILKDCLLFLYANLIFLATVVLISAIVDKRKQKI